MTLVEFAAAAASLKDLKRAGWIEKLAITDGESVADHSYSASMIGMMLSDVMGLQTDRVTKMILLHDLAESKIGDIVPGRMPDDEKLKIETKAFLEIVSGLPSHICSEYMDIWNEFCSGKTPEARLAMQADKIDMALQAVSYVQKGRATGDDIAAFVDAAKTVASDEIIQDLLVDITARIHTLPTGSNTSSGRQAQ